MKTSNLKTKIILTSLFFFIIWGLILVCNVNATNWTPLDKNTAANNGKTTYGNHNPIQRIEESSRGVVTIGINKRDYKVGYDTYTTAKGRYPFRVAVSGFYACKYTLMGANGNDTDPQLTSYGEDDYGNVYFLIKDTDYYFDLETEETQIVFKWVETLDDSYRSIDNDQGIGKALSEAGIMNNTLYGNSSQTGAYTISGFGIRDGKFFLMPVVEFNISDYTGNFSVTYKNTTQNLEAPITYTGEQKSLEIGEQYQIRITIRYYDTKDITVFGSGTHTIDRTFWAGPFTFVKEKGLVLDGYTPQNTNGNSGSSGTDGGSSGTSDGGSGTGNSRYTPVTITVGEDGTGSLEDPLASTTLEQDIYKPSEESAITNLDMIGTMLGTINNIGIIISVIALSVMGVKYMMGSVEEKAEYKQTLKPYLLGVFMLAGGSTILNLLYQFAKTFIT